MMFGKLIMRALALRELGWFPNSQGKQNRRQIKQGMS